MKLFLTLQTEEPIECPNCQNEVDSALEAELKLVLDKGIKNNFKDVFQFDFCDQCKSIILPLDELDSWLMFDDLEPNQIKEFWIHNHQAEAFVSAVTPAQTVHNIPWQEYRDSIKLEKQRKSQPVPNAAAVLKLRQDPKLEWFLSVQPMQYIQDDPFEEAELAYTAILLDPGTLAEQETKLGNFSEADLMLLIRRACALPPENAQPKRPKTVLVGNSELLELLSKPLQDLGIGIQLGNKGVDEMLRQQFNEFIGQPEEVHFFEHASDQEIKAFEQAARAFFALQPWNFTTPDDCLAFRFANGAWQYATIMGHLGESFGMTMYQNWLGFCQTLYNANGAPPRVYDEGFDFEELLANFANPLSALQLQGGMESFNASEKTEIPVQDMHRLSKLGVKPVLQNRYAFAQRFNANGEFVLPRLSIAEYTKLLEALVEVTSQKAKKTVKLDGQFADVDIKYPSSGLEEISQARYRLEFEILKFRGLKKKLKVVIYADATERFSKIAREIIKATKTKIKEGIYIYGFHNGESYLWKRPSTPKLDPSPVVFHCLGVENFMIHFNAINAKIQISLEPESSMQGLEVVVS